MTYEWSQKSLDMIATCNSQSQVILHNAIRFMDLQMIYGHRGEDAQTKHYEEGRSKLRWPESKHNKVPSLAFDVIPYPGGWPQQDDPHYAKHLARFYYMGGVIKMIAANFDIALRWGGDWDSDNDFTDQTFDDLAHFEVVV